MATGGVEFAQVSYTLPDGRALLGEVSFRCAAGTTTALLGRSGSGKTTLLRTVNGLVRPTAGRVLVNGREVPGNDVLALRRGIGYVIQESGLFPHLSIERNITMPLEVAGEKDHAAMHARAVEALGQVGLDEALLARRPWQLSGGQRQRAGVARALITSPAVVLMDEPFGALDPLTRAEMQATVYTLLRKRGITCLIVTHDLPEALFLADRVVLLERGAVVANVAAEAVMASQEEAVAAYVRATQPRGGNAGGGTG